MIAALILGYFLLKGEEEPWAFKVAREFNYEGVFKAKGTPEEEENHVLRTVLSGVRGGWGSRVHTPYPGYYPHIDPKKTKYEISISHYKTSYLNLSDPNGLLMNFDMILVIALKNNSYYELHPAIDIGIAQFIYNLSINRDRVVKALETPYLWDEMVFAYPKSEEILSNLTFRNVTIVEMKKRFWENAGKFDVEQFVIISDETREVVGIVVLQSEFVYPIHR